MTVAKKTPAVVYAEMTPNPQSMKYVANSMLIPAGGMIEFNDPNKDTGSELLNRLLNFPFVDSVFVSGNFISVNKNNLVEWDDVVLELREYIQQYLNEDKPFFKEEPKIEQMLNEESVKTEHVKPQNQKEEHIIMLLDEYVRPAVESDGGAINFVSYEEGVVKVSMKGACSGCPSSTITLKNGIETLLKRMLPEIKEVVSVD